jgi:hypothetical protein
MYDPIVNVHDIMFSTVRDLKEHKVSSWCSKNFHFHSFDVFLWWIMIAKILVNMYSVL